MEPTPMQLAQLAMKCGLKVSTVQDLLKRGWVYSEALDGVAQWRRMF